MCNREWRNNPFRPVHSVDDCDCFKCVDRRLYDTTRE